MCTLNPTLFLNTNKSGEQYVGKCQSVIALFKLDNSVLKVLTNLPQDYTPGQVHF